MIVEFSARIPAVLHDRSGSVFYSGRKAFGSKSPIYVLGVNPGGDPVAKATETVCWHTTKVLEQEADDWSAYRDESWENAKPGTWGMQPRVLHLFDSIGVEPGTIPASNVVFVRSAREEHIKAHFEELAALCWPFHEAVIERLEPRVVVAFGQTAGGYICRKLGATSLMDEFVESNKRRWKSRTFQNRDGRSVVVLTHPGIANWEAPTADATILVKRALTADA